MSIAQLQKESDTVDRIHKIVIRCPLCHGSGAVQCKTSTRWDAQCIFPQMPEDRCSCCDGKGWIGEVQRRSKFCTLK